MEKVKLTKKAASENEAVLKENPSSAKKPLTNKSKEQLVENIVNMGYAEEDVRRALRASFDNPERAIEYLINGIPKSPTTPEGASTTLTTDSEVTPFEFLRTNKGFRNLKRSILQNPQCLNTTVKHLGRVNPQMLHYLNENYQEFLSMLFELTDDEDEDLETTVRD